ncbi:MAG: xanthine dehydrogenase small subunit, partial [Hyphomicrobiales bacterium]
MREGIRFLLGSEERQVGEIDPTMTVLRYLRETERRCGTKEGCAEGDCGACTVVLGEAGEDGMTYRAVNSCIQFMPLLDGKQLITVEDLGGGRGALHPVQQALCDTHASQCGFCTPGFVMSLYAQSANGATPDRQALKDILAGNLCRCTGYGPILDAGERIAQATHAEDAGGTHGRLTAWRDGETVRIGQGARTYYAPATTDALAELCSAHPDAHIISGLTDVGLWVTKQHRVLDTLIFIGNVEELKEIDVGDREIAIGAGATLADAHDVLGEHFPDFGELIRRFASLQIRNVATLGGNVANGSPIGDTPPALIALGAQLQLRHGDERRTIPLEDFFIAYGRQDRRPGEFVEKVIVPRPVPDQVFRCYKLSKRFDQDISAVCGAFSAVLAGGKVAQIRICFGGMAGTPHRASQCEAALADGPWTEARILAAMNALERDYQPMSDMRGSAGYRMRAA